MSLHPHVVEPVPEDTARVAQAAFPKGHPYLTFRDALGTIFQDEDFTALFPAWGQPGLPPWRLALVTILQFRENLADRQAAEAVQDGFPETLPDGTKRFSWPRAREFHAAQTPRRISGLA